MNRPELWEHFLHLPDDAAQCAWLTAQPAPLPLEFFEELKAQADALLLEAPKHSLEIAEAALLAASFATTPLAKALAYWTRGNAYIYLADYTPALADYGQAIQIYQTLAPTTYPLEIARLQINMINPLKNLGRYAEALTLAETVRSALQLWAISPYMATLEMNVGSVYRLVGRYADALAAYEHGRAIFVALGNEVQAAQMDVNRARLLVCMDQFAEAETLLQTARQVLCAQEKHVPVARIDLNLATLFSRQGRHRQAMETYQRARTAFTELGNATDAAVADLYRTYDTLALNLLPETLDLAVATQVEFAQRAMPRYSALSLINGAGAARKLGRYREALAALDEARAIFHDLAAPLEVARLDLERAECLRELGEIPAAIETATLAQQVLREFPLQAAQATLLQAEAWLTVGQWDDSANAYTAAVEALRELPSLVWRAYDGLGRIAQARGRLAEAYTHYCQAIACIETAEATLGLAELRAGFLDDKLAVYRRAVGAALALADHEAAFDLVERAKIGMWRDVLSQAPENTPETVALTALRQQWHWLYQRLNRLEEEPEDRADDAAQQLEQQRKAQAHWKSLREVEQALLGARWQAQADLIRREGLSLRAAQQRAPEGGVLLDYYCAPEVLYVFVIQRADVQVVTLPGASRDVQRLIGRWRFNLDSARLGLLDGRPILGLAEQAEGILRELYQLLVAPLRSHLPTQAAVWVMPHAELWQVPFAALYDGAHYWVETTTLSSLPGLLSARLPRPTTSATPSPLVVGYSDGGRLTYALNEAQAVAATLENSTLLLDNEATLAHLQAQAATCSLLHLATHGVFRADAPLFSTLQLADGPLTAEALETWQLSNPELVTLSACETGVSLSRGSDLLGLARTFWRAGARRLLVSQWAVDDVSTAELMVHFYREFLAGCPPAHALRLAQVAALQKYRHPFYWAGFTLMEVL
ncbi:MAG: CHAT domain-containing protein [Anaerolineae bacterium]|nr:CHAT domain-containing protein [Anaerolineae bacterium]